MNQVENEMIEQSLQENMSKVRTAGLLAGSKAVAGVILDMCKKKQNPALTVKEIERFCKVSLGLTGKPKEKVNENS